MNIVTKEYFWPVALLLAFVAALSFFYPVYQAVAVIPALTAGIILIDNPRRYIFWYLFLLALFPLLQIVLPMGMGKHLDELIGGAIGFLFVMGLAFRRLGPQTPYFMLFQTLMAWAFISMLFNRSPPMTFVRFLLAYGLCIPVYLLAKSYIRMDGLTSFIKGAIAIFWINFILNVGWFLRFNPLPNEMIVIGSYADTAIGTFKGANFVAYFCCMLAYFFICVIHFKVGSHKFRWLVKVTLVALFVQLYFTYTNHAYPLFVAAGIPLLFLTGIWKQGKALLGVMGGVVVIIMLMNSETEVGAQFSSENIRLRKERLYQSAKVIIYKKVTVDAAHDYPYEWLIGAGPGNGVGPIAKDNGSPMAFRYLLDFFAAYGKDKRNMQFTSITGNPTAAVLTIWSDLGMVGFILYFLPFILMMMQTLAMVKNAKTADKKAFAIGLLSSVIFLLVMCALIDILFIKFYSYALWAIFGVLCGVESKNTRHNIPVEEIPRNTHQTGITSRIS